MLERKIYSELLEWKKNRKEENRKKCLIIKGALAVVDMCYNAEVSDEFLLFFHDILVIFE